MTVSSNDSAVTVPATITLASGASTASFTANATSVSTSQTATLAASTSASSRTFAMQLNAATPALDLSAHVAVVWQCFSGHRGDEIGDPDLERHDGRQDQFGLDYRDGVLGFGGGFPATLNPGQAAVLTVQFDPTTANPVTGQLTISSNASAADRQPEWHRHDGDPDGKRNILQQHFSHRIAGGYVYGQPVRFSADWRRGRGSFEQQQRPHSTCFGYGSGRCNERDVHSKRQLR